MRESGKREKAGDKVELSNHLKLAALAERLATPDYDTLMPRGKTTALRNDTLFDKKNWIRKQDGSHRAASIRGGIISADAIRKHKSPGVILCLQVDLGGWEVYEGG